MSWCDRISETIESQGAIISLQGAMLALQAEHQVLLNEKTELGLQPNNHIFKRVFLKQWVILRR
jgi:hypothetical protein